MIRDCSPVMYVVVNCGDMDVMGAQRLQIQADDSIDQAKEPAAGATGSIGL
jgi:hypothetical protein